jgi:voltage-gated potassium channel
MKAWRSAFSGRRRVRLGLGLLAGVAATGTLWYWLVEHFSFVDAAYQTVFTISTVGFAEIRPLGDRGRIFTMGLIVVGVGVALYTLAGLVEELVENQLGRFGRWRMERRIEGLSDHVVVCGFGRVGQGVVELVQPRSEVVVVDRDDEQCEAAGDAGLLAITGDSTDDAALVQAGIERAGTLIVCLQSDADAISTVLSARALNENLRIVARANAGSSEAKLRRAGVDHVVNPLHLGSVRLATFALQPAVADFMDVVGPDGPVEFRLEELVVADSSDLAGKTLADSRLREATGVQVLAVRQPAGEEFESNPGADTVLEPGAIVIAIGTDSQLGALADQASGPRAHR